MISPIIVTINFILVFALQRECGRQPIPRKRPPVKMEDQSLLSDHPYVDKVLFPYQSSFLFLKCYALIWLGKICKRIEALVLVSH